MKIYTLADLRLLPKGTPPVYVVDGLLRTHRGRPSILGGYDHVGKSTLAIQLAKAVSEGKPFLGRPTVKGKVIYWQSEESVEDTQTDFLNNISPENNGIVVLHPESDDNNFTELRNALDANPDTVLVIVETLSDFVQTNDIKDNDELRKLIERLRTEVISVHDHAAFLMLHWLRKTDTTELGKGLMRHRLLGGTMIAAKVDTMMYIHQISDSDPRRLVLAETRRGRDIKPTYLVYDAATQHSELGRTYAEEKTELKVKLADKAKDVKRNRILAVVRKSQGSSMNAVVSEVGGYRTETLNTVHELIEAGRLVSVPDGQTQRLYTPDAAPKPKEKTVDEMKADLDDSRRWLTEAKDYVVQYPNNPHWVKEVQRLEQVVAGMSARLEGSC